MGGLPRLTSQQKLVAGITVEQLLCEGMPRPASYDLIKLDGDGPEGKWLAAIRRLLSGGALEVESLVVEANGISGVSGAQLLQWFQQQGYEMFRLAATMDSRRVIDARGQDVLSPPGTMARLDRFGSLARDSLEEEVFGLRGMRHLFRWRGNLSVEQLQRLIAPIPPGWGAHHLLLTRDVTLKQELAWRPTVGPKVRQTASWKAAQTWASQYVRQVYLDKATRRRTDRGPIP